MGSFKPATFEYLGINGSWGLTFWKSPAPVLSFTLRETWLEDDFVFSHRIIYKDGLWKRGLGISPARPGDLGKLRNKRTKLRETEKFTKQNLGGFR